MEKEKLNKTLELHKKWLDDECDGVRADLIGANLHGANLRYADLNGVDLYDADLRYADLNGADLDYSSGLPLSCKGLDVHIDDRITFQILYHLLRNVKYSRNVSKEIKAALLTDTNIELANRFHRVDECGKIEVK